MKKFIAILVIATLFVACNNAAKAPVVTVDSVKAVDSTVVVDSSSVK